MHKKFIKSLQWNSSTTFVYKIAILLHQVVLYYIIPSNVYGLQNSLFAGIYTLVSLTNFGFDETIAPFFSKFSCNKQSFLQLIYLLFYQAIILFTATIIICLVIVQNNLLFLQTALPNLIIICSIIVISEGFKKSLLAIMQLAFLNKQIAIGETCMLFSYIMTVYSLYSWYGKITLYHIFIPMAITSILETWYLIFHLFILYEQLSPEKQTGSTVIPFKVLLLQRLYNYINQISQAVYSPNSMTIFFAYTLGFGKAAIIKFLTNTITLLYTCLSKVIGVSSGAVFSAINHMPLPAIRSFFNQITKSYFQWLSLISIVILTIITYAWYSNTITAMIACYIFIFFIITFLQHICITYEQFFISQHASYIVTIINVVSMVSIIPCFYWYSNADLAHQLSCIGLFIFIKIASLTAYRFLIKQYWSI